MDRPPDNSERQRPGFWRRVQAANAGLVWLELTVLAVGVAVALFSLR
jgi:hypothetical protein